MKIEKIFKNNLKEIKKLVSNSKYRKLEQKFILESLKPIKELVSTDYQPELILISKSFYEERLSELTKLEELFPLAEIFWSEDADFKKVTTLVNPEGVLAVIPLKIEILTDFDFRKQGNYLLLDSVNDPGNLGTIARTALWFGFKGIIFYDKYTDPFSPKVLRSSMGAILRLELYHQQKNDSTFLSRLADNSELITTLLGKKATELELTESKKNLVLALGNEANGLSEEFTNLKGQNYLIPRLTNEAESLNLAVSAGIIMSKIADLNKTS